MKKSTYNKWKYTILEEFAKDLETRAENAKKSAQDSLERCRDEETGEINKDNWYYSDYLECSDKAEAIKKFLEEVEKL